MLEYSSVVWNSTDIYLVNLVGRIQHKFSKRILLLSNLYYTERLAVLGLESLELRHLPFDLMSY
jgi:hypothetical protein